MDQTIKAGDIVIINVRGRELTIEPIPYGNIKKLMKIASNVITEISSTDGKGVMMKLPDLLSEHMATFVPLLFRKGTHDFINEEWIDDNLSLADMRKIVEAAIKVNGLEDFFGRMRGSKAALPDPVATTA